jgi:hypothetical protein
LIFDDESGKQRASGMNGISSKPTSLAAYSSFLEKATGTQEMAFRFHVALATGVIALGLAIIILARVLSEGAIAGLHRGRSVRF